MIKATIVADSVNRFSDRITTMVVTMPRIVLAEFNTHRMFSRNSASSRAIPLSKMIDKVNQNPFIPLAWQKDHKGMQGVDYIENKDFLFGCESAWVNAKNNAVSTAKFLNKNCNLTKQLCNRLLEPFMYHTVLVTSTEWENFFALRCPEYLLRIDGESICSVRSKKDYYNAYCEYMKDAGELPLSYKEVTPKTTVDWLKINQSQAEIHIQAAAEAMWDALRESKPDILESGQWHIPFGAKFDMNKVTDTMNIAHIDDFKIAHRDIEKIKVKIATARCARVSYDNFEGKDDYEADIALHDRLASSGHWSPFEHCAMAMNTHERVNAYGHGVPSGNFFGFKQYRKEFNNENIT